MTRAYRVTLTITAERELTPREVEIGLRDGVSFRQLAQALGVETAALRLDPRDGGLVRLRDVELPPPALP